MSFLSFLLCVRELVFCVISIVIFYYLGPLINLLIILLINLLTTLMGLLITLIVFLSIRNSLCIIFLFFEILSIRNSLIEYFIILFSLELCSFMCSSNVLFMFARNTLLCYSKFCLLEIY